MNLSNCRGDEAKNRIVTLYKIKPVVYMRLLAGQKIEGCCGPITDKYYLFEAENKKTKKCEDFFVGYDCGSQFLQLIGHAPISLFNPFQAVNKQTGGGGGGRVNENGMKIDPLNRELKNAIHILCSAWGGHAPTNSMKNFLGYINDKPERATNSFAVTAFNDIVGKDAKNRKLSEIINDLREKNPTLRDFIFPLMEFVLAKKNKSSNL